MKKLLALLLIMSLGMMASAQETTTTPDQSKPNDEYRTIFGNGEKITTGWFLGANGGYTRFCSSDVALAGIGGGLIINHNFIIGGQFYGISNNPGLTYENFIDGKDVKLEGGWGGFLLEYTLFPSSPVHVTFPLVIGGGELRYTTIDEYLVYEEEDECDWDREVLDSDRFFVIEPGVKAEVNILKWLRLDAGVSYRYTPDLSLKNTSSGFINNFTYSASLKFGKF